MTGADLPLQGFGSFSNFGLELGREGFESSRDSMAREIPVISGQQRCFRLRDLGGLPKYFSPQVAAVFGAFFLNPHVVTGAIFVPPFRRRS